MKMDDCRTMRRIGVVVAALLLTTSAARSAEVEWKTDEDGFFHTGTNWVGDNMPGTGDDAVFDVAGVYTVFFGGAEQTAAAYIRDGDVTLALDAGSPPVGGWTYTAALWIGNEPGQDARLTVSGGTLAWSGSIAIGADGTYNGANPAGTGEVIVTSTGRLEVTGLGRCYIGMGDGGIGTLRIIGGEVSSTGRAHVGGDNGIRALLEITEGGSWTITGSNARFRTHSADGEETRITVSGANSLLSFAGDPSSNYGAIGMTGKAIANITGGGRIVSMSDLYVGRQPGSVANVTVSGQSPTDVPSELDVRGILYLGREGNTTELTVEEGAVIRANRLRGPWIGDSLATLTVRAGSRLVSDDAMLGAVTLGESGLVVLRVEDSGVVEAGSLDLRAKARLELSLGAHDPDHVMLQVSGEVWLSDAGFALELGDDFVFVLDDKYTIAEYGSAHAETTGFLGLPADQVHVVSAEQDGTWYDFELNYADGGNFLTLTAIPEPGTLWLIAAGGLLVALRRRR